MDGARIERAREPLRDQQKEVKCWSWGLGPGAARSADRGTVRSAEFGASLPCSVRVAGFGAVGDTRACVLPLILHLGELYAQLNQEASYPGAQS
jgi:hypothetical protein